MRSRVRLRPKSCFVAPGGGITGAFERVRCLPELELPAAPAQARQAVETFLRAIEAQSRRLAQDEFLAVLFGYEASVALDEEAPRHPRDPALGPDAMAWVVRATTSPSDASSSTTPLETPRFTLRLKPGAQARHKERVERCREELVAGTLYQANLAHALDVSPTSREQALAIFCEKTEAISPPNFAVFWPHETGVIVSLSPECLVRFDLGHDATRPREIRAYPIKGTRPRGQTPEDDARLLRELATSEKDGAEHVMIVDLLRHDLGQIAIPGGVTVEHLARPLPLANVHHLESVVHATLRDDVDLASILRATTPGGSITGAPKSAAVEVIAALEEGPRGPYTGTIGIIDATGRGVFNLLIRTWLRPDAGPGALHVGGGIVVDSAPEAEFRETVDKAKAFAALAP